MKKIKLTAKEMTRLLFSVTVLLVLFQVNVRAQDTELVSKKQKVPAWLNIALGDANQLEGGLHVYQNWAAYNSDFKISRVKIGMLIAIVDPAGDGSLPSKLYQLKTWATPADIPLQTEWEEFTAGGDNLGDHTATENIKLNEHYLSNDGGANEGLTFDTSGNATFSGKVKTSGEINALGVIKARSGNMYIGSSTYDVPEYAAKSGKLVFYDGAGPRTIGLKAPASINNSYSLVLPGSGGADGQVLQTDASGNLSWATPASLPTGTSNQTLRYGASGWEASSLLQNDGSKLTLAGQMEINTTTNPAVKFYVNGGTMDIGFPSTETLQIGTWDGSTTSTKMSLANDGDLTVTGDLTVSGNDITFGNNETISNATNGRIAVTANTLSTSGDLTVSGSDITLGSGTGSDASSIVFNDAATGNSNTVTINAPNAVTTAYSLTLPAAKGADGQVLITDGSGVLSWQTPSWLPTGTSNQTLHYGASGWEASSALTNDGDDVTASGTFSAKQVSISSGANNPALYIDGALHDIAFPSGETLQISSKNGTSYTTVMSIDGEDGDVDATGDLKVAGGDLTFSTGGTITFEGSSADAYETTLQVANPTADRTITFPNAGGTVALTSDIVALPTGSSDNTLRYNGSAWVTSGALTNDGSDVTASGTFSAKQVSINSGSDNPALYIDGGTEDIAFPSNENLQISAKDGTSFTTVMSIGGNGDVDATGDLKVGGGDLTFSTGGTITFEGSSADAYETTLQVANPTADRTITFPNAGGTVALTSDIVTADNLGNHTATQNIKLNDKYLSNDGGDEGIKIENDGAVTIKTTGLTNTETSNKPSLIVDNGIYFGASYHDILYGSGQNFQFSTLNGTTASTKMTLTKDGYLGIGTSTPRAPLEITLNPELTLPYTANYFWANDNRYYSLYAELTRTGGSVGTYLSSYAIPNAMGGETYITQNYSAIASGVIAAELFMAYSDARIKNVLGTSDSKTDLETIDQVKITDYTYKDWLEKGNRLHKKVIAQQVEKVYPLAVTQGIGEVPDIMQTADSLWAQENTVNLQLATDSVNAGDKLKVIYETYDPATGKKADGSSEIVTVDSYQNGVITYQSTNPGVIGAHTKAFVYGHQVNDFRTVDYEAIAMLNVSATQELHKQLKELQQTSSKQIAKLSNQNKQLQEQVATLLAKNSSNKQNTALQQENETLKGQLKDLEAKMNILMEQFKTMAENK